MSAALRPSQPPPVVPRPKALPLSAGSLRGKGVPRSLTPGRQKARLSGAEALSRSCAKHGISAKRFAELLGLKADRQGAEALSGALPISIGEVLDLLPKEVMIDAVCELLLDRVARERIANDTTELRMAPVHIDALRVLLGH